MKRAALLVLLLSLSVGACGYFNSLYNAERRFAEGERAARRGEPELAARAYTEALERAAVSYRRYPDSRWADDALLLVARSRFALGHYPAARAALGRVLEQSQDGDVRAEAAVYLGASHVRLQHPDSALAPLDQALGALDPDSELHALAGIWRGRALLALDRPEAWQDLERALARAGTLALDAGLEIAAQGVARADSTRALAALARLAAQPDAALRADSVIGLLHRSAERWGPQAVLGVVPERAGGNWQPEPRTRLRHARARLMAAAGDTAGAVRTAVDAAQQSSGIAAARARQDAARWVTRQAQDVEDLGRARAILLPAIGDPVAVLDVRRLRTVEVLMEYARGGQSAALFAAAEFTRDTLASPRLARQLFLTYADVTAGTAWAPKGLLAALALSGPEERAPLLARLAEHADNVYVAATAGRADTLAYRNAEERLGRAVSAAWQNAHAEAQSGDVRVARAVTLLDSLRLLARTDSLMVGCGSLLDSLALRGVRADSVRTACMRADTALVTKYLAMDTLQLRGRAAGDSTRRGIRPDTLHQ